MFSKRFIKKLSIIIVIVLVVLWFGGNLGLYLFIKYTIGSKFENALNYTPEKLRLTESNIEAKTLYLMGLKLKFPFYKEDISYITPFFFDHQLNTVMIIIGNQDNVKGFISFAELPNYLNGIEKSLINRILDYILHNYNSYVEFTKASHYARLEDYSWWNLLHNVRLAELLILKAIRLPLYEENGVYNLETPHLKGFLGEGVAKGKKSTIEFSFAVKDIFYTITFIGPYEISGEIKDIITTIQPVEDIEESYREVEALYENKGEPGYPKELLLLSMISLKGTTMDNLSKLLKIMEDKNYDTYVIDEVKKEIEYLKR